MNNTEKFWDRTAKRYDRSINDENVFSTTILDHTRPYLHSDDVVLDFACATGRYAIALAPDVEQVWGIDISAKMIEIANANAAERRMTNLHLLQGEIADPRLEVGSFDLVMAISILHLVDDPGKIVSKVHRLLKPGGLFISSTPCLGAGKLLNRALIRLSGMLGIVPKASHYKPGDVGPLIRRAYFELLETRTFTDQTLMVFIVAQKES